MLEVNSRVELELKCLKISATFEFTVIKYAIAEHLLKNYKPSYKLNF